MPFLLQDSSGLIDLDGVFTGVLLLEDDTSSNTAENPVRFRVKQHRKGRMSWEPIVSTSLEYVGADVKAIESGVVSDPTGDTVQIAFISNSISDLPDSGDWNEAVWDTNAVPNPDIYTAFCLVGPGGTIELDPDEYIVYVKITDSPEVPVKRVPGILTVL